MLKGKKPLAQQLNNVAVQRNYSKRQLVIAEAESRVYIGRRSGKAGQGATEYAKSRKIAPELHNKGEKVS